MDGYGRPADPWDRRNPPSWDREHFQREWYDRERGINTWEGHAGAPVETWEKRGVSRDVGFASSADQQWERGRMVELDQGDGQWDMEERPSGGEMYRRDERFGGERERYGGRDPYYERERGNERERQREADLVRSRRSHSSERSRGRSRDRESRREYRRRSRSRSRSRSRERRRERDDERRRRNTAEPEPSTIIMMRNLRSTVTEDDISKVLGDKLSQLREVRLIRDRGGTSKGFAFLEFFRLEDARMWLDTNKNDFYLQGGLVSLEYSRQRFHDRDRPGREDWTCFKCNTRNYRNIYCSTCECSRHESESLGDERGRDPAKSLERESNPPSQNDGSAYAFQRVVPPPVGITMSSGSVPNIGLPTIPVDLVQRIRSGSFVDASELLPELFEVASYQGEGRENDRNLYSVNSPLDWAVAFTTYGALLCAMEPSRAHDLFAYMGIVLQIARSLPRNEWLRYDRAFRQMAAINPSLPWSELDYQLWLSIAQPSAGILDREGSQEPTESMLVARSPTPPPLMTIPVAASAFPAVHMSPQVNSNSRWFPPLPPQSSVERDGSSQLASQEWSYPTTAPVGGNSFEESARPSFEEKQVCQSWNETRCDVLGCPHVHLCSVCRSGQHRGRDCPERHHEDPKMIASASPHAQNQHLQVCRNWNAKKCFFRDCKFLHACIHCKSGDHRGPECPAIVEPTATPTDTKDICRNWNGEKCFFRNCKFLHACIHCKSGDHRGPQCPMIVEPTSAPATTQNICRNWNAEKCFFRDCKFFHACIHCKLADHRGPQCPTIVEPPSSAPPRHAPPRDAPPRDAPPRNAPPRDAPPRHAAPPRDAPPRDAPPRDAPPRDAPPRDAPSRNAAPTRDAPPPRDAPPRDAPARDAPPRDAPPRDAPDSGQAACRMWNNGWCFVKGCRYLHVCSRCRSITHKAPNCLAQQEGNSRDDSREICKNWNAGKCALDRCKYLHACSVCRSTMHTAHNCHTVTLDVSEPMEPAKDSDVCRKWNIKSCVGGTECKKLHVCLLCKTPDHSALSCPRLGESKSGHTPGNGQLSQVVCRNWNYKHCFVKDCQYQHVCMLCRSSAHPATLCSQLGEGDESEGSKDTNAPCCRDWNNSRCVFKDCRFQHACFRCRKPAHRASSCPYAK